MTHVVPPSVVSRDPASREGEGTVLPFRRRRPSDPVMRRRRRPPWLRWAPPLLVALATVGTPLAALGWALNSSAFALGEIDARLDPTGRISARWVESAARPFLGHNLWRLDLLAIESELERHPWVDRVAVSKRPPSTLVVYLEERREIALYRRDDGLWSVDHEGALIAPWRPERQAEGRPSRDLPILSGGRAGDLAGALAVAREIEATVPAWLDQLSEIEILGERDFRIFRRDVPYPVLVRAGTLAASAHRLEELLPVLAERWDIAAIDLRFAQRIVIEPVDPSHRGAGRPEGMVRS